MSYEARAKARKHGAIGAFEDKWLTVPTNDVGAAIAAFHALGYETAGVRIMTQDEATEVAATIARNA